MILLGLRATADLAAKLVYFLTVRAPQTDGSDIVAAKSVGQTIWLAVDEPVRSIPWLTEPLVRNPRHNFQIRRSGERNVVLERIDRVFGLIELDRHELMCPQKEGTARSRD